MWLLREVWQCLEIDSYSTTQTARCALKLQGPSEVCMYMFTAIVRSSRVETTEVSTAEEGGNRIEDAHTLEYYLAYKGKKYTIHHG